MLVLQVSYDSVKLLHQVYLCEGESVVAAVHGRGAIGPQTLLREGADLLC